MNLSELIAAYGEQALDKAAREGYAVRCKTHGPRVLAQYATADIMKMQLDDARVIVSAYLDALSVPPAAVVGEPVAWQPRYKQEVIDHLRTVSDNVSEFAMTVFQTKAQAEDYGHGGHEVRPLYAAPSAPDGWQQIETAPKDGTPILAYNPVIGVYNTAYQANERYEGNRFPCGFAGWLGQWFCYPTHWRPLPSPPALGGAGHE